MIGELQVGGQLQVHNETLSHNSPKQYTKTDEVHSWWRGQKWASVKNAMWKSTVRYVHVFVL
jgi:hypothetical protein